MKNTNNERLMLPIRLDPYLYKKIRKIVYQKKEHDRGFSMNKYITTLIEKDLKEQK